jgi:hypothetical protein
MQSGINSECLPIKTLELEMVEMTAPMKLKLNGFELKNQKNQVKAAI